MLTQDVERVMSRMATLGSCLLMAIDSGEAEGISVDEIYTRIDDASIIKYVETQFPTAQRWALYLFSDEDKNRLLGEWQSMRNAMDSDDHGITNNGIHLLIAYIFEGVRMRSDGKDAWPGPEPFN